VHPNSGTSKPRGELAARANRDPGMDASRGTRDGQRATVTVDRDGIIHQWGDGVTEVVGHRAEYALGRSLNFVIPPVLRPLHWWGFDRAMKRGRMSSRPLKVPALCNDGRIVVAHAAIELITDQAGGTEGAVVRFVGVGAPWQGKAWQAALAPIDLARQIWQQRSHNR
jgi:PAS domain S-box-containing protein